MSEKPEELTEHTVVIGGIEHTMLLNDEDAERLTKEAEKPATKAKTPANKAKS